MIRFVMVITILTQLSCKPSRPVVQAEAGEPKPLSPVIKIEQEPKPVEEPAGPPAFANDSGGKILARLLPPQSPPKLSPGFRNEPKTRPGLLTLERAELPQNSPSTNPIGLPPQKKSALRPRLLPDAVPLSEYTAEPTPPHRLELPLAQLVRTPSRDVNLPIGLSVQARYQADRASVDDPTFEFSLERSQSDPLPLRQTPAPFVRVNLPEPFENRAEVRTQVPEPPVVAPTPQTPK